MKSTKRAVRRQHTQRVQHSRSLQAKNYDWDVTPARRGYYKRHGVGDCGRARCGLCHHDKRRNKYVSRKFTLTLRERRIDITEREFINDVYV